MMSTTAQSLPNHAHPVQLSETEFSIYLPHLSRPKRGRCKLGSHRVFHSSCGALYGDAVECCLCRKTPWQAGHP